MWVGVNIAQMADSTRSTYHHGDLRNALVGAGARLAESGGPDAVGVRAAARLVGVSPTAAYRHFENAEELLEAVRDLAFQTLMETATAEMRSVPDTDDPGRTAMNRLAALGRAYVNVAIAEPGLFRVAFTKRSALPDDWSPTPLALVARTMDDLAAAGLLPPQRRQVAEIIAWASVHGIARLVIDGPLSQLPDKLMEAAIEGVITTTIRGLTCADTDPAASSAAPAP